MERIASRTLIIVFLLAAYVVLAGNGTRLFWADVELNWLLPFQQSDLGAHPLFLALQGGEWDAEVLSGLYKVLPALCFLVSLLLFYRLGQLLFGISTATYATIFAATNLVLLNGARFITVEILNLPFLVLSFLSLLLYLKRPTFSWLGFFAVSGAVAVVLHPFSAVPYLALLYGMFWRFHPAGRQLQRPESIAAVILLIGLGLWLSFDFDYMAYGWMGPGVLTLNYFFLLLFLSVLPWLGFLMAGFRDMWVRFRIGEEMTLILIIWLGASLVSFSYISFFALSVIAGRQARHYFAAKYPYGKFVRAGFALQMVAAALIAILAIISTFRSFGMPGFRAAMFTFGFYWVCSMLAVIGLFLKKHQIWFFSGIFSVLLSTFLFWSLVGPLQEQQRNRFVTALQEKTGQGANIVLAAKDQPAYEKKLQYYLPKGSLRAESSQDSETGVVRWLLQSSTDSLQRDSNIQWFPLNSPITVDTLVLGPYPATY